MTVVPDSFDRANETPLASPWATGTSESAFNLSSNSATPSTLAADCCMIYSGGDAFNADQGAQCKVTMTGTGAGTGIGLALRHSPTARTYYRIVVCKAGSNNIEIARFVAGSFTSLATRTQAWTDGDLLAAEVVGPPGASVIRVFRNGVQLGADVTDNSTVTTGFPGLGYSGTITSGSVDDWVGYEVGPPARPRRMPAGV